MSDLSINIKNESDREIDETMFESVAALICASEMPSIRFEIGILICTEELMRKHNSVYRGVKGTTDILSFVSAQMPLMADGREHIYRLCDLIIDINQIDRQKGTNSLNAELMEVYIHGLLHLCGYDHIRETDRKIMKEKELHYQNKLRGEDTSG
ncbi:MAG: rRNA maturation RNase YbeY [Candidatus Cloacimonadaceae bacterium]|nr:rRNA maturation RNase YbeY [Candidatus Cloacimonadaceae bacterium]MDP3115035.1 rRNA maturation RNase YbeY [Candidatus Cloacimonadaceae bacterium]